MLDDSGEQARAAVPSLAPGSVVAGFTLEGPLASGSFGSVYRASRDGRPFALKLVLIEPRSDREVDALRLMKHPNVVCFHGLGFWPDEKPHYLVLALELVEGRPLDVWAREENPSALELVMRVLLPFALTLADVHAAGVVHRDIKEANIIVREADGQPVLVDFGAAGVEGTRRLTMRLPPGTPEYRSPEALRFAREWEGEPYPVKPGDDLWALGVVTYWLLTRTLPFGDRNSPGLVRAILGEVPPAPHELNPRVPPALGELCMRMLEKEPEARYADARALAAALSAEWARADRSWREPLFPGDSRKTRPAPAPASPPVAFKRKGTRRWWSAGLVTAAALTLGVLFLLATGWRRPTTVTPLTQRTESLPPYPSQQAGPRQEMASAQLTGRVGGGAAPEKSPTPIPAPVTPVTNSEEPAMTKSPKTRALIAAGCVAGSACASGPMQRPPPPPAECPPGAAASHKQLGIYPSDVQGIFIAPHDWFKPTPEAILSEGNATALIIDDWGTLPSRTPLYGELFFGKGYVYGRFTQASLPSGETVPVCIELVRVVGHKLVSGVTINPGSTPEKARVDNILFVRPVNSFK
jgi:serine/threonine-protein kinase